MTLRKIQYGQYLRSDHWVGFKKAKACATEKRCSICATRERVELHHLFYRDQWDKALLSDTRWLCRDCHASVHDLISRKVLRFPKPDNHHSCFALTKTAVKKARGFGNRNMFAPE